MISKLTEAQHDWVYSTLLAQLMEAATSSPEACEMRITISKLFQIDPGYAPEFIPVESSNLSGVAWRALTLYVKFKGGNIYAYVGVSNSVYQQLVEAESAGKFLNAHVKGHYDYEQLS